MNSSLIIFTLLLFILLFWKKKEFDKKVILKFIIAGCTMLSLEAGLRHLCVGPDTPNYYYEFKNAMSESWDEVINGAILNIVVWRDPVYALIVKLFSMVIPSWQLFLFVISALFFFSLGRLMYKYINSITGCFFAFVLYLALFHVIALSGIRQCITTSIMFLIIPSILNRNWKIVIPVILAGSTIHISLLFSLTLIPFMYISPRLQKRLQWLSIVFIPIIWVSARSIVGYMASFLENDYYAGYAKSEQSDSPIVYVVICSLLSLFIAIKSNTLIRYNAPKMLQPAAIMMALSVPLISLDGSMIRIGQYYTLFLMITLPFIFDRLHNKRLFYLTTIILLTYSILNDSIVYHFFWENVSGFNY